MSIGVALYIINGRQKAVQEREKSVTNIEKEIDLISKMSFWEYLEHMKGNEKEELKKNDAEDKSINSVSTIDEIIEQKLSNLEKLIKEDENLNYKQGLIRIGKIKAMVKKRGQKKNNNNNCPNDKKINGATGINGDIIDAKKKDKSNEA